MGGARQLLRKLSRVRKGSRLPAFFYGSSQHHQGSQFFPYSQHACYLCSSGYEEERKSGSDMPKSVLVSLEDGDYIRSLPRKDVVTYLTDSGCLTSSARLTGFSAWNPLSQIRARGAIGPVVYNGYAPTQQVSLVRFSSTSTGQQLEDELGNTPASGGSAEIFDGGNADVATTLTTSEAQAASEVSAVIGDCSYPTAVLQLLLENVHLYTGLPWWATIVVTTIGIRTLCLPVAVYQIRSTAKLSLIRPDLEKINNEIKDSGYDPIVTAASRERIKALFAKQNTSPFAPFIGAVLQAPIFMCFFFGIKNMAERVESFKEGGTLWFTDLSVVDSTFILPMVLSASMLLTVELNAAEGMEGNPYGNKMKNMMRFFCAILFPVSLNFSSALFCYWITSTYFSLLQSTICKDPRVKAFLNIPLTAHLAAANSPNLVAAPPQPAAKPPARVKSVVRRKMRSSRRR